MDRHRRREHALAPLLFRVFRTAEYCSVPAIMPRTEVWLLDDCCCPFSFRRQRRPDQILSGSADVFITALPFGPLYMAIHPLLLPGKEHLDSYGSQRFSDLHPLFWVAGIAGRSPRDRHFPANKIQAYADYVRDRH